MHTSLNEAASPVRPILRLPRLTPIEVLLALFYLALAGALLLLPGRDVIERLRMLDGGICAQLPTHSFYPGHIRLPLCARNTGIYLGFALTFGGLLCSRRRFAARFPRQMLTLSLLLGIGLMALDGINSVLLDLNLPHLYPPHNLLRLGSGLLAGLAIAVFFLPALNQVFWRWEQPARILEIGGLFWLGPPLILAFLAAGSQNVFFLYPLALLSSGGLVGLVALINSVLLVFLSGRTHTYASYRALFPLLTLGILLGLCELLALSFLRQHYFDLPS